VLSARARVSGARFRVLGFQVLSWWMPFAAAPLDALPTARRH
jgi:hypothetical protein